MGIDGSTVVQYHQWTGEEAYEEFARDSSSQWTRAIDRAVPGIRRHEPIRYEVYRDHRAGDRSRVPGCVVAVRIGTDGPGRARRWIDAVLAALETDPESRPGLISASADGSRILNYAEWTDVDEHVKALDNVEGSIGHGPEWDRVRTMPGVSQLGLERFRPGRSLVVPPGPRGLS